MSVIHLSMLGTPQIRIGRNVLTPGATRRFALMLYLLNERHAHVPRAKLIELFLHDARPEKANHSLREMLYELRQLGVPLTSDADGVGLSGATVTSDYVAIVGASSLNEAQLAAIGAGFLPGYTPALSDTFGEWLAALRAQAVFALSKLLIRDLRQTHARGDWASTERVARVCLRVDPLHEEATLSLAEMLALGGAKAEAMRVLDQYIVDVGGRSTPLSLPASVLRRRIAERLPQRYGIEAALPFVGREAEMATLADRLDRACNSESGCVVLLGEAGIGKTRIATEFVARSALKGVRFVAATAQPHDTHRPMGAFADAVPQLLELPGALGCSPESMAALKRLTIHDPAARESAAEFPGQGEEVAISIARAIADLVDAITSETPLIVWLEDAHWLDEMSLQMAASLVSNRIARRLLLVLTTRERRALSGHCGEHATTLAVRPLPPETSRSLVAGALVGRPAAGDESNVQWLVSTAAGNPFFLVSLLNHVERTGKRFAIPATISELLDQRIAALSSEASNVLEACVLLGKHATIERVVAAMELPHFQLIALLRELEDRRMIVKSSDIIQASHWLVADAVQRASSPIATELSHRRIAELLEAEARSTQSPALLWDCGEHWLESGDAPKAIQAVRECSRYAVEIGRAREGAELLLRAAQMTIGELHVELIEESIRLASTASEPDIILAGDKMLRAAGVSQKHDDLEAAELMAIALGTDAEEMSSRFQNCLRSPESTTEHKLQVSFAAIAFCVNHSQTDLAHEVVRLVSSLVGSTKGQRSFHLLQSSLIYHTYFGDTAEATKIAHQMLANSDWSLPQQADACRKAGLSLWLSGDATEALAALGRGFELASKSGLARLKFRIAMMTASVYSDLGHIDEGRRWLDTAERLADKTPSLRNNFDYLITRTDIASATCDVAELQMLNEAAHELGIPLSNRRVRRWAAALRALIDHLNGVEMDSIAVIEELTSSHRNGEFGDVADFEMAVALKISLSAERRTTTTLRLSQYLGRHRRRPAAPLMGILQQAVTALERGRRRKTR